MAKTKRIRITLTGEFVGASYTPHVPSWRPRARYATQTEDRMIRLLDGVAAQGRSIEPEDIAWGGCLATGR